MILNQGVFTRQKRSILDILIQKVNRLVRSFAVLLICMVGVNGYAQAPGCPNIVLELDGVIVPPNVDLDCADECVNLSADVLVTGLTTSYEVSTIPYAPPFPFNSGTQISVNIDDRWSSVINLPFDFCYFGTVYNNVIVGSNGVISFDVVDADGYCEWSFDQSLPGNLFLNTIFGIYHDIDPSVCGSIFQGVIGEAPCRTYVVSYDDVCHFDCNDIRSTTQIVLYETTNVIEVYVLDKPTCNDWNDGNAVIGIQNASGNLAYWPTDRNTGNWTVSTSEAWRFTPSGTPNWNISWLEDGVNIGSGLDIQACPVNTTTTYIGEVEYENCNGDIVIERDTVVVTLTNTSEFSIDTVVTDVCDDTYTLSSGLVVDQSGIYTDTVTCDSILVIDLTLNVPSRDIIELVGCNMITYDGTVYTSSASFSDTITSADPNGCDSIYIVNIIVFQGAIRDTVDLEDCRPIEYNGTVYTTSTEYIDTVVGAGVDGCDSIYYVSISVNDNNFDFNLGNDTLLCDGVGLPIGVTQQAGDVYNWNTGVSTNSLVASNAGLYSLAITRNGCTEYDSIVIDTDITPIVDLGPDVNLCEGESLILNGANAAADTYEWQDGSDDSTFTVTEAGLYWIITTSICGASIDSIQIEIEECVCTYFIPNAFSPNGDGLNDRFNSNLSASIINATLEIYSRWGERVFESDGADYSWDGKYKNENVPSGVYSYILKMDCTVDDQVIVEKGNITIMR